MQKSRGLYKFASASFARTTRGTCTHHVQQPECAQNVTFGLRALRLQQCVMAHRFFLEKSGFWFSSTVFRSILVVVAVRLKLARGSADAPAFTSISYDVRRRRYLHTGAHENANKNDPVSSERNNPSLQPSNRNGAKTNALKQDAKQVQLIVMCKNMKTGQKETDADAVYRGCRQTTLFNATPY